MWRTSIHDRRPAHQDTPPCHHVVDVPGDATQQHQPIIRFRRTTAHRCCPTWLSDTTGPRDALHLAFHASVPR